MGDTAHPPEALDCDTLCVALQKVREDVQGSIILVAAAVVALAWACKGARVLANPDYRHGTTHALENKERYIMYMPMAKVAGSRGAGEQQSIR